MMKRLLPALFLLFAADSLRAQGAVNLHYDQGFIYKIKLQEVTDFVTAKEIAWALQEQFKFFPHFDDQHDRFEFYSDQGVGQDKFTADMISKGYTVTLFEKDACAPCTIKEQEQ